MANGITLVVNTIINFLSKFGIFSGFLLVYLESIIPVLPLSVFIALNILIYGNVIGFIVSLIATILGSMTSFFISRKFSKFIDKKIKKYKKTKDIKKLINKLSFANLLILFAIPFTPAFMVNIAAGLSKIDKKKYLLALIIGKIPMVYFWAFIGKSLSESLTDISTLFKIVFMIVIAYLVGKVANKFMEE